MLALVLVEVIYVEDFPISLLGRGTKCQPVPRLGSGFLKLLSSEIWWTIRMMIGDDTQH